MKHHVAISLLLLLATDLQAQHVNLKKYTIEDGLPSNDIRRVYQDTEGFIWIATMNGLSRYDGHNFTNYGTDEGIFSMVNDIYELEKGKLLVAQNNGAVSCIENGKVKNLPGTAITINQFVPMPGKKLYLTTDNHGICEWKNNKPVPINPGLISPTLLTSLQGLVQLNDSVFLGYNEGYRFLSLIDQYSHIYSRLSNVPSSFIFKDSHQRVWIGNPSGLKMLSRRLAENKQIGFEAAPPAFSTNQLKNADITAIFEDGDQTLWFGTKTGVIIINKDSSVSVLGSADGLSTLTVRNFFEDREKNIWIADVSGLIKIAKKNTVKKYDAQQGAGILIRNLLPIQQKRLLLFSNDVKELDIKKDSIWSVHSEVKNSSDAFSINKSEVLFCEPGKYFIYARANPRPVKLNLPIKAIDLATEVDENNLLIYWDSKPNLYIMSKKGSLHNTFYFPYRVTTLAKNKEGNIWIGTFENGLYKIQISKDWNISIVDSVIKELPDLHIRSLFLDSKGNLWAGTRYKGVCKILKQNGRSYSIQCYDRKDGLSNNSVIEIAEDATGNIWAGEMEGMDKLIPVGDHYRIFNFGLLNNITGLIRKVLFTEDGYLAAAGYPNVIVAKDEQLDTLPPPRVQITSVLLQNNDTINHAFTIAPKISYNKPQISFNFSALQFFNEKQIFYSYRLIGGSDTNWRKPRNTHEVSYASLKPGNYNFEVRALGWNGQWGQSTVYSFTVISPFWQQWWFIGLSILAFGSLIYMLYRYRLQQLMRLQKIRNRIATDLHDDIGSSLTNINILSRLSKQHIAKVEQEVFLNRISEEVNASSQALDDIIWSVNSSNDTLEETLTRMRRYAAELFDADNVHYEFEMDPSISEKKMGMELRRDFYLIYKEAVNNISKHARASHVQIKIGIEKSNLQLIVIDDGKGFDSLAATHRNGLKNLHSRAERWKGFVDIHSEQGKGTYIRAILTFG